MIHFIPAAGSDPPEPDLFIIFFTGVKVQPFQQNFSRLNVYKRLYPFDTA